MLYKKYHRSYVSQFKKGTIILDEDYEEETGKELEEEVSVEPYICSDEFQISNENYYYCWIELVVSDEVFIKRNIVVIDEKGKIVKLMIK